MSAKQKILIQLDPDRHASVFDRVVAVDAGADHVFSYAGVAPEHVRDLVYGAIFTRGGDDLGRTAIFIGGSDVRAGEEILAKVKKAFIGSLKVSVLLDPSGANTTAAAAVAIASSRLDLNGAAALVLGSTGPVGRRVARLLALRGAAVRVGSRALARAEDVATSVKAVVPSADVRAYATEHASGVASALDGAAVVVSAGGPGACLLPMPARAAAKSLHLAIDLNAVPPEGIEGVRAQDSAAERDGQIAYGALGVGGLKMKVHKAAIARLFEVRGEVIDAEGCLELGLKLLDH